MKIDRQYKDEPGEWTEVTEEEFLRRTEWAGYWKKGTALETLKDAGKIETPWAIYRIVEQGTFESDPTTPKSRRQRGGIGAEYKDGLN